MALLVTTTNTKNDMQNTNWIEYVTQRFNAFYDRLDSEHREMWYGDDAIYSRKQAIASGVEELQSEGITNKADANRFDLEAIWE